ncbi:hypothetical protein VNI00_009440 [Paramarasmius palmivorus]|uniref:Uncharacterized protein n=1 Tax=Paramarasmius palmivorus TaxID=297713 RepID=A0AAW0CM41_9AGAR
MDSGIDLPNDVVELRNPLSGIDKPIATPPSKAETKPTKNAKRNASRSRHPIPKPDSTTPHPHVTTSSFAKRLKDHALDKKTRKLLTVAVSQIELAKRRTAEVEAAKSAVEREVLLEKLKLEVDAVTAKDEAQRAKQELEACRLRLKKAEEEAQMAKKAVKVLDEKRSEAELTAALALDAARKVKEDKVIEAAKENGRLEGYRLGLTAGRKAVSDTLKEFAIPRVRHRKHHRQGRTEEQQSSGTSKTASKPASTPDISKPEASRSPSHLPRTNISAPQKLKSSSAKAPPRTSLKQARSTSSISSPAQQQQPVIPPPLQHFSRHDEHHGQYHDVRDHQPALRHDPQHLPHDEPYFPLRHELRSTPRHDIGRLFRTKTPAPVQPTLPPSLSRRPTVQIQDPEIISVREPRSPVPSQSTISQQRVKERRSPPQPSYTPVAQPDPEPDSGVLEYIPMPEPPITLPPDPPVVHVYPRTPVQTGQPLHPSFHERSRTPGVSLQTSVQPSSSVGDSGSGHKGTARSKATPIMNSFTHSTPGLEQAGNTSRVEEWRRSLTAIDHQPPTPRNPSRFSLFGASIGTRHSSRTPVITTSPEHRGSSDYRSPGHSSPGSEPTVPTTVNEQRVTPVMHYERLGMGMPESRDVIYRNEGIPFGFVPTSVQYSPGEPIIPVERLRESSEEDVLTDSDADSYTDTESTTSSRRDLIHALYAGASPLVRLPHGTGSDSVLVVEKNAYSRGPGATPKPDYPSIYMGPSATRAMSSSTYRIHNPAIDMSEVHSHYMHSAWPGAVYGPEYESVDEDDDDIVISSASILAPKPRFIWRGTPKFGSTSSSDYRPGSRSHTPSTRGHTTPTSSSQPLPSAMKPGWRATFPYSSARKSPGLPNRTFSGGGSDEETVLDAETHENTIVNSRRGMESFAIATASSSSSYRC